MPNPDQNRSTDNIKPSKQINRQYQTIVADQKSISNHRNKSTDNIKPSKHINRQYQIIKTNQQTIKNHRNRSTDNIKSSKQINRQYQTIETDLRTISKCRHLPHHLNISVSVINHPKLLVNNPGNNYSKYSQFTANSHCLNIGDPATIFFTHN